MVRNRLRKLLASMLILLFFANDFSEFAFKAVAASTIQVHSLYTHRTTYRWCQHLDGHWSGGTAMFGIKTRSDAGGQPAYKDEIVKILTNLQAPTRGWQDDNGNIYAYSSLASTPAPSTGDFTDSTIKTSVSGEVTVANGNVFVEAKIGNGVKVNGTKSWTGTEPKSICGKSPGYEYLININVKWVSTVVADTEKFIGLEIDPTYKTLSVGQFQAFTVYANWLVNGTAKRYPVTNDKLSWTSSLPSNAPVLAGRVSGVKETTSDAKITATFIGSGGASGSSASASVKVIKNTANSSSPTADFDILPGSTISYGDSFTFQPVVTIPTSCTFTSLKYKITQGSLSYETTAITSSSTDTTFSKATYPPLIQAGKSHSVTMTVNTSCGNVEAGPHTLYVQDEDAPATPPPDPVNNPPHVDVGWYDPETGDMLSTVWIGTKADLLSKNATDPDGDPVELVAWDFSRSSAWLAELPVKRPITGLAPGYSGITLDGIGLHTVYLTVRDSKGAEYTASGTVGVIDPTPVAVIKGSTRVKEGRTLAQLLDGTSSYSPIGKKIVDYKWTNKADRYPNVGSEVVKLTVTDEDGRQSLEVTHTIEVIPDDPPIASLIVPAEGTRLDNVRIQSASYSPDGDTIVSHQFELKYDSNNNGFADDAWSVVQNGSSDYYSFTPDKIGNYLFRETVCEDFGKCSNTDLQAASERTLDVKNLPPEVYVETSSAVTEPDNKQPISLSDLYDNGSYYSLDTRAAATNASWTYQNGALMLKPFVQLGAVGTQTSSKFGNFQINDNYAGTLNYELGLGNDFVNNQTPYTSFNNSPITISPLGTFPGGNVVVDEDSFYIRQQRRGNGGITEGIYVYRYDKKTKALLWTQTFKETEYIASNMVVANDRIYFTTIHYGSSSLEGTYLHIIDKESGDVVLKKEIGSPDYGYTDDRIYAWPNGLYIDLGYKGIVIDADGNVKVDNLPYINYYGYSPRLNSIYFDDGIRYTDYQKRYFSSYDISSFAPHYTVPDFKEHQFGRVMDIDGDVMEYLYAYGDSVQRLITSMKFRKIDLKTGAVISDSTVEEPPFVKASGGWTAFNQANGDEYFLGKDANGHYLISTNKGTTYINVYKPNGQLIKSFNPFARDDSPNYTPGGSYPRTTNMFVGADGMITLYGQSYVPSIYKAYNFFMTLDPSTYEINNILWDNEPKNSVSVVPFDDQTFLATYIANDPGYSPGYGYGTGEDENYELIHTAGESLNPRKFELGSPTNDLILGNSYEKGTSFESTIRFSSDTNENGSGVVFNAQDSSKYYSVEFDAGKLKVNKTTGGIVSTVFSKTYPITVNADYTVKIVPSNESINVYVNRILQTTIESAQWDSGKFGFMNRGRSDVSISSAYYTVAGENETRISGVVVVGQPIDYTVDFEDPEGDARLEALETWKYEHDPRVFLNSVGNWGQDATVFNAPVSIFTAPGDYTFTYQSKDDPNPDYVYPSAAFSGYRQDSNEFVGTIRVHRRPEAIFTATLNSDHTVSYTDRSYDPDRYNPTTGQYSTEATGIHYAVNHGIIDRKWRYRLAQSASYVEGQPTKLLANGTYIVELSARDEYGAWSEWASQTIEVTSGISPLPPVAGFTLSATMTYRNSAVTIDSTANDPQDGARENLTHAYYISSTSDGVESLQSNSRTQWDKLFSSLGIFTIRQVVTNSYGLSDEANHSVTVVNRKPVAAITMPASSTSASPTLFETLRPTFEWSYQDSDDDVQTKWELRIYKYGGTLVTDTGVRGGADLSWTPTTDLTDNTKYYVQVRTSDGYEWSDWSANKYFQIITNKPPTGDFDWTPEPVYEGDTVTLRPTVNDPDRDGLAVTFRLTSPSGSVATRSSFYGYPYAAPSGPSLKMNESGDWIVRMTVDDGNAPPVTVQKTVRVRPLGLTARVLHTEAWEANRLRYNEKHPDGQRSSDWFWAGEAFVLEADATDTGGSATKATRIVADAGGGLRLELTNAEPARSVLWSGTLGSADAGFELADLEEGPYVFTFTVTYANGTTKTATVPIRIRDTIDDYVQVHRIQ